MPIDRKKKFCFNDFKKLEEMEMFFARHKIPFFPQKKHKEPNSLKEI